MPGKNYASNPRQNEVAVTYFPYYSMVRLATVRSGAGPFTYTGDTVTKRAFAYKIGDVMDAAGFPAGTVATKAETNLQTGGGQTNQNADLEVWGISIAIAKGDPLLIREFFRQTVVEIGFSGNDTNTLGPLYFFPQVGGPYGQERTHFRAGADNDPNPPLIGQMTNGNPNAGSFFRLPEPMIWRGIGSGKKDTSLIVSVTPQRAISVTSTDRAAVAGAAPGASGQVEAFTSPADGADGTYIELMIRLHTKAVSELSENQ